MSEERLTNGENGSRDSLGRFAKGNPGGPGNPHAQQVAQIRTALLESVSGQDIQDIVGALVKKAKSGDVAVCVGQVIDGRGAVFDQDWAIV